MNSSLEYVKCVICENSKHERIQKFSYKDLNSYLVLCKNCGLAYLNPRWNKKQYLNYYKNSYDNYYRPDLIFENHVSSNEQKNIILERFKKNNIEFNDAKRILDIGSGSGNNLVAFKNNNLRLKCYAIEPSISSQELLRKRNIQFISDDVDSDWDKDYKEKFDIIIMRHVLEHFLNPLEVLKKVRNVLTDSGVLYIAVPNNLIEKRGEGWLRVAHTYYFNQYTLKAILNRAELIVDTIFLKDEFNQLEIFTFAQKGKIKNDYKDLIDQNVFNTQKKVYSIVFDKKYKLSTIKKLFKKMKSKFK